MLCFFIWYIVQVHYCRDASNKVPIPLPDILFFYDRKINKQYSRIYMVFFDNKLAKVHIKENENNVMVHEKILVLRKPYIYYTLCVEAVSLPCY